MAKAKERKGNGNGGALAKLARSIGLSEPFIEKARLLKKTTAQTASVFRRNRIGMLGLVILLAFMMMAVFPGQIMWVLAVVGGWEFPYGPFDEVATVGMGIEPSPEHWLGTDLRGNDILARTIYGAQVSLTVGVVATVVSMGLGALVGLLSGYWGGWRDEALMRVTDVFLVLPWLVLMIVLAAVLPGGASISKIIIVIGITGWSSTARIVRAQVLSIKKRAFIERARAVGSSDLYIVRKHIFPTCSPLVFANSQSHGRTLDPVREHAQLHPAGTGCDASRHLGEHARRRRPRKLTRLRTVYFCGSSCPASAHGHVVCVLGFTFVGYALDEIFESQVAEEMTRPPNRRRQLRLLSSG